MLEHTLSEEERSQIVQTIEMFEAITQTQPDDYQSLEILKEGYRKIGRLDESFRVSRRLAEAYYNVGSYTLALQECEVILLKEPNAPEILALQGEIEHKLQQTGTKVPDAGARTGLIATDLVGSGGANGASLIEMPETKHSRTHQLQERGDDQLAKFLIVQQLFPEEEITAALDALNELNKDLSGPALASSFSDNARHGQSSCGALGVDRPDEVRLRPARILRRRPA